MEVYAAAKHEIKKPETEFGKADAAFAFISIICGFLYWCLNRIFKTGAGTAVFSVMLFTVTFIYMSRSGVKQNAQSIICLLLATMLTAQISIFDNGLIASLSFLLLSAVYIYWICLSAERRIENRISVYILGDAIKQLFIIPFSNFGCCVAGINGFSKSGKLKKYLYAVVGLLIFMPFIAVVIMLLVLADSAFEEFTNKAFEYIETYRIFNFIIQILAGIPVAFYLYGLAYGNIKARYTDRLSAESADRVAQSLRFAPGPAVYAALTSLNLIYIVFFAVQAVYFFSAFSGGLPEQFSYAEYARRGFFELCGVAVINLAVLTVSHLFAKREPKTEPKMLRAQTLTISLFTMLLIATALSKMIMYIDRFGLTQLRVLTSWFMALLFFIFLIISVRQTVRFNAAKLMVICSVLWFLVLSFCNIDGLTAKYNISRYQNGTLEELDISALGQLSDAAVPHLYDLYIKTDDGDLRVRIEDALLYREHNIQKDIRQLNYQKHIADKIRTELRAALGIRN